MLEFIAPASPDPLWAIAAEFAADTRDTKVDLVVGVYRDQHGKTPTMAAVKMAEARLANEAASKAYKGLSGNQAFNAVRAELLFASVAVRNRAATIQTVGGTGALRLLSDFIALARPDATVWISDPGYVNHEPIARAAGLRVCHYPYLGSDGKVNEQAMLDALGQARRNDVVLLHGCCHNPTGADMSPDTWAAITRLAQHNGFIPLVDIAYLGLGDGLEADLAGLRTMADQLDELLVVASCSKNLGLYSERTGCAMVLGRTTSDSMAAAGVLENLARTNYSMPPDHGAAVAAAILDDAVLRSVWIGELGQMRERISRNRDALVDAIMQRGADAHWEALRTHRGMFSMLPLRQEQMVRLRQTYGVYGTNSGRINIAGLKESDVGYVADSILSVLR